MTLVSKIMLGFVFIAAVVFMWFAARTLATHDAWRAAWNRGFAKEASLEKEDDELVNGKPNRADPTAPLEDQGNRLLRAKLDALTVGRGRVWREVGITGGDLDKGIILNIETPSPHGINKDGVLWIFSAKPAAEQGQFFGEFTVTDAPAGGKQITVVPTFKINEGRAPEQARLAAKLNALGGEPVVLYERRPQDLHEDFAALTETELQAMVPAESLSEYLRDGKEAEADDPAERKVKIGDKEVYRRRLRDYSALFIGYDVIRTRLLDEIAGYKADLPAVQKVVEQLKAENAERTAEIEDLKKGNAQLKTELGDVEGHEGEVKTELDEVNKKIEEALQQNKELAAKLNSLYERALNAPAGEPAGTATAEDRGAATVPETSAIIPETPAIMR